MRVLFVEYPKCSTCKKAKLWLEQNGIEFDDRDIKNENPAENELREWKDKSGQPLKTFFNTSGMIYRSMGLKDKLNNMTDDEQYSLLASDGMLVKRPIVVGDDFVLTGFREKEWEDKLSKH